MLEHLKQGDRRNVTVLFTDLEGFTPLSQQMDPEELDNLITRVFSEFERIIQRHDGSVEKYIGDAMVAVFGSPRIHEDDPARAVNAALDFYQLIANMSRAMQFGNLRFRTGIHTGLITTGMRGDHRVVTGHTMNVASRLQEHAEPGTILVSQATLDECGGEFSTAPLEIIRAKGLDEPITAATILGKSPHSLREERLFIGRESIIQDMISQYLRFDGSSPGGYLITGEPGVGKTGLVKTFLARLRRFPDFSPPILHTRARKFQLRPFAVVIDTILNLIHLPADTEPSEIARQLRQNLNASDHQAQQFNHILQHTGSTISEGEYLELFMSFFSQVLAKETPGPYRPIVFLDNGDFIDPQSRVFFRYAFSQIATFPFTIITDRDPSPEILNLIPGLMIQDLPPLEPREAEALLASLAGDKNLGQQEKQQIISAARGNPLFLHSFGRYLLQKQEGEHFTENSHKLSPEIPATIQNVYLSELSTYNEDIRDLLKKLSVFNHSFSLDDAIWMQEHTDSDPSIVPRALEFFLQQDIISQDQEIYYFRHDVQKKVIYSSLLNHNKRVLHRLIAQRMRMQAHPHPVRLIHHLVRSNAPIDALEVFQQGSDHTINLAYLPYLETMAEAIKEDNPDLRLSILFARCAILFNNGLIREADKILQEILQWAIEHHHPLFAARAYHVLTGYNTKSFRFQKAYYCGMKALDFYLQGQEAFQETKVKRLPIVNLLQILMHAESMQNHRERATSLLNYLETWAATHGQEIEATAARVELMLHHRNLKEAWDLLDAKLSQGTCCDDGTNVQVLRLGAEIAWGRTAFDRFITLARPLVSSPTTDPATKARLSARLALTEYLVEGKDPSGLLNQASYFALSCQNDFDKLHAHSGIIWVMSLLHQPREAAQLAKEHLPLALRHSAFLSAFGMLISVALAAEEMQDQAELEYHLTEADHIYRMGMSLEPDEVLVYLYLRSIHPTQPISNPESAELLGDLSIMFLAKGDTRTIEQPGDPKEVLRLLQDQMENEQHHRWFTQLGIMNRIEQDLNSTHELK